MFFEELDKLSPDDMRALAAHGVPQPRVSDWKKGRRIPTRAQALALATVRNLNFDKLERELTILETKADAQKNAGFAQMLASLKGQWHFS
ncbi:MULTISPECIES: hypothetical protein [Variovorax]|uniref:hypothetical protein n=1 Tax=Variovorax TaxID=34072 RepID=UPI0034E8EAB1